MIPHRENHLVLDIANSESETELQGNRQIIAPYRGAVSYVQFTTDQRKPWYTGTASRWFAINLWL